MAAAARPLEIAGISTSVAREYGELRRMEPAWRQLQDEMPNAGVFSSWQWNQPAARHFCNPSGLHVWLMQSGGEPVALAPLAWSRVMGQRLLSFIGTSLSDYSRADYQDVLIAEGWEDRACEALVDELDWLSGSWDVVRLQELPATSPLLTRLPELAHRRGWTVSLLPDSDVYRVELPSDRETYYERLSGNVRGNAPRKLRKLQREHGAAITRIDDPSQLDAAMSTLFELHDLRWHGGREGILKKQTIFPDDLTRNFHRDVARNLLEDGHLDLELLHADGMPIGARYSFEFRGVRSFYASGYHHDDAWSRFSLGTIMDLHSIDDAIDRGFTAEDLLRGEGEYKQRYAPAHSVNQRLLIFASRAAQARYELQRHLRRVYWKAKLSLT
ncbi:MAG TPA: GNAT family N-acetyltransferase [Dehalococcoidia bacterium]|nr:GNAT family N-acetyltransferase [Dehalococcoidia bacterium]